MGRAKALLYLLMRHGGGFKSYRTVMASVEKTKGVVATTPFIVTQGMIRSKSGAVGAVIRGIDPSTAGRVMKTLEQLSLPGFSGKKSSGQSTLQAPGIVLGKELARNLGVIEGDLIYLMSPQGMLSPIGHLPAMKQFKITGFFQSGMYEYDQTFAFINLKDAQKMLRMGDSVSGIDIRVTDIYKAREIADQITSNLGFPYWTRDWMQMNQNLFRALKM